MASTLRRIGVRVEEGGFADGFGHGRPRGNRELSGGSRGRWCGISHLLISRKPHEERNNRQAPWLRELRRGLDHGAAVKGDRGLGQQPAIDRSARPQRDHGVGQHNALAVRGRAEIHRTGDLPEHVLGQRATCQMDCCRAAQGQVLGDLEDPHIRGAARERLPKLHSTWV